jgi:hypothetical protein
MDISSEGHIVLHILGILGFIISIYVLCRQNKSTFADMDKNNVPGTVDKNQPCNKCKQFSKACRNSGINVRCKQGVTCISGLCQKPTPLYPEKKCKMNM